MLGLCVFEYYGQHSDLHTNRRLSFAPFVSKVQVGLNLLPVCKLRVALRVGSPVFPVLQQNLGHRNLRFHELRTVLWDRSEVGEGDIGVPPRQRQLTVGNDDTDLHYESLVRN